MFTSNNGVSAFTPMPLIIETFSQPPYPKALKSYLDNHFSGASVKCAYEASKFGYWIYRELVTFGYECLVVNAADIPTSNKETSEKADPSDSRKIGKALRAGLLTGIHVPEQHTEGDRQLFRYRKRLWADLIRVKNRIKDKFLFTGIEIPQQHDNPNWSKAFLKWIKDASHTRRSYPTYTGYATGTISLSLSPFPESINWSAKITTHRRL